MRNPILAMRGGVSVCVMFVVALAGASAQAAPPTTGLQLALPVELSSAEGKVPAFAGPLMAAPRQALAPTFSSEYPAEVEPNNTSATATPLGAGPYVQMQGAIQPIGDVDVYSFTAAAGDRVHAAVMTAASAGSAADSQINLLDTDGTTVLEFDEDDGSLSTASSSIAGRTLPAAGTYYLRINPFNGTATLRPYFLHVRLHSGAPTPEVEPNDTPATANVLPANGSVSGARNPAAATEQDWYSFSANAGDTVFLSLDADPERDNVQWDGRLGIALFGDASNQILVINDASVGSAANPLSEALFMTIKTSGTYYAFVDSASVAVGGPTATYALSVSVQPPPMALANCTTYTSTDVPKTIGPANGLVSSVITVPGNPRIADVNVEIQLNHALMNEIDAHLRSPAGNDIGLFTDIGAAATGGQSQMNALFDDEAAIPPTFTVLNGLALKPELAFRLAWLDGEDAGGTWTLDLRDDTNNANGGTLTGWSLRVCEAPPPPACASGFVPTTVYSTDFEAGAAGFSHTGTADEWELGLPATAATTTTNPVAAFNTCNSGTSCWKTDLDNTYELSSSQDLLSPAIDLSGLSPPVVVRWAQKYQMENSSFDAYSVDLREVGGANPIRLFEWLDATMVDAPGNPATNIGASAGWGVFSARADALAGLNSELNFHVGSDNTVNLAGVAIDDVSVTACRAVSTDLAITKTDGVTSATPGGNVTYTIVASNAGPDANPAAQVTDVFSPDLTCTWTCVGAAGGTCAAAGAGNIADSANLPAGGSVTYTASCAISAAASGSLVNTATVAPGGVTDPAPGNNSATDTDTLDAVADLSILKTDGTASATPGGNTIYTIGAANSGPSSATGASVTDTFPAALTCTWTCAATGGGSCTAAGSGNIADTINLPAGASATYTATCAIDAGASGSLVNTATVAVPAGVTDPTPGNNSATDTDTLNAVADLAISKTDGVTSETPGGNTTYTIVASNSGPSSATGASVTDTFPAALTCTWTCAAAGGGSCTAAGSGNIADTINLPAGASATYTATCAIDAGASGSLVNTATVAVPAGVTDPTPANNSATDTDTLGAVADLAITKTDGVTSATPGGNTTYTIVASNAGPSNATAVTVADTFPAPLTCSWTCVGTAGGTCTAAGAGNIADSANLPAGGSATYTASCTISAAASGSLVNTATVAAPAGVTDPTPANNSATDTDALGAEADLSITKTDGVTSATPGGNTTYTIVAANSGPSSVTGATVTDIFPATLTCAWTCVAAGGGSCTAAGSGNLADTINLPAGASATYTATCAIDAGASGSLVNTATVAAPAGVTDPTPANNSATDTDALGAEADLSISKTDGLASVPAGGNLSYAIVVGNAGPSAVAGAAVGDSFPAACVAPSWTCSASGGASCPAGGSGDIAANVDLPVGGSAVFTANCPVDAGLADGAVVSNTASVAAPAGVTDPNPVDNSATDSTTVTVAAIGAVVSASKSVSGSFVAGGTVSYTIVLGNSGGAQADNPGDELIDVLPAQLDLVSASASSGTAVADVGTNTVSWNGAIAAGGSVTLTITAAIVADASGTVSNQAGIAYDGDANGSNETSAGSDDPVVAGVADPTRFVINGGAVITPVPTLTPVTLLLLALGLLLVALPRTSRRRG